jgi:type I restriction enzyme R subunit
MTFTEANTVEAHLRDLLAGVASARPAQPIIGLARSGSQSSHWGQV